MYQAWIKRGIEKGLSDIQIYAVKQKSLSLKVYQQKVDQNTKSEVEVVSIKGIYHGKMTSITVENLNEQQIDLYLNQLIENAKHITVNEPALIFAGSKAYPEVKDDIIDFDAVDMKDKISFLQQLEKTVLDHEKVAQVQTTVYQESDIETSIINSKGLNLSRKASFAYAYAVGVFKENDDIQTAYHIEVIKDFSKANPSEIAQKTIEKGVKKLGGEPLSTAEYETVFNPETFADIIDAFQGIFSGEAAYRHLTQLENRVGEKVALESISLIDDPLHEKAIFKTPFDDEGVACYKKHVIENGVFKGFFHNLKTAKIFDVEPTGNGFNGGISSTNLYLEPTDLSLEQLLKPIKNGFYVTDLVGLHAGISEVSGDFSLQASGFRIVDGKLDKPVKMVVVSGNIFKLFNQIEAIAADFEFNLSGIGSASVHVGKLSVAGK